MWLIISLLTGVPDNRTTTQTPVIIWIIFGLILSVFAMAGIAGIIRDREREADEDKNERQKDEQNEQDIKDEK